MKIGFHASHERFAPSELLKCTIAAEAAGFHCAMCSDHFKPWSRTQGHSGYAWSWIGAALARTQIPIGLISVAGYRYHPAVLAQGAATLSEMFPDRFWLALGSGERLNEDITGLPWPTKAERDARFGECATIIGRLLDGERVTHRGLIAAVDAELYSRPQRRPPLLGAALTEPTAELVGQWADGLLTVGHKPQSLKKIIEAFRRGGGARKPVYVQVSLNWAATEDEALRDAHEQWRFNAIGGNVSAELRSPEDFETAARHVRPEDLREHVLISSDLGRHAAWLAEFAELGIQHVYLHQVGVNQHAFIEAFGSKVIPQLR